MLWEKVPAGIGTNVQFIDRTAGFAAAIGVDMTTGILFLDVEFDSFFAAVFAACFDEDDNAFC
jgi:hypothetical protein